MLGYRLSLLIFIASLLSIAASQLLTKWRFGVLGLASGGERSVADTVLLLLSDPWIWVAGLFIATSVIGWYVALSQLPLSFMMPTAAIISPIVVVFAFVFLNEPVTPGQFAAVVMIALGVAWLGYQQ